MLRVTFGKMLSQSSFSKQKVREAKEDTGFVNCVSRDILIVVAKSYGHKESATNKVSFSNVTNSFEKASREPLLALAFPLELTLMY